MSQSDASFASASRTAQARAARPATLRSRLTNDPLMLPAGLNPRSSEGRRWRDLALAYSAQLGDRMKCDGVGTQLHSLLWLSLELDRMTTVGGSFSSLNGMSVFASTKPTATAPNLKRPW